MSVLDDFSSAYTTLFNTFASHKTKSLKWRKWQLKQLYWLVNDNEDVVCEAIATDLGRPINESKMIEFDSIKNGIHAALENLEAWNADEIPEAGFVMKHLGRARIRKEPLGVVLIIGAANAPFEQCFHTLVSVIAAGCCAIIKPADHNRATRIVVKRLAEKYLDSEAIRVVNADTQDMPTILQHKFNHIHFTGGEKTARIIAQAAARNLTPTVLELGGRGPAIVCPSANIELAAKRIAWGKTINHGQICLSINHVIVHPDVHDHFVDRLKYWYKEHSTKRASDQMIHESYYDKVDRLVKTTKGDVHLVRGGADSDSSETNGNGNTKDRVNKCFPDMIVTNVTFDDPILREEMFGPVLTVIKGDYIEACKFTAANPPPLGLYAFTQDRTEIDYILSHTLSGGVTINDIMLHGALPNMPFGGVGESGQGYGRYEYGFREFIHLRAVVEIPYILEKFFENRYPPYDLSTRGMQVKKPTWKKDETMEMQTVKYMGPGWGEWIVGGMVRFVFGILLRGGEGKTAGSAVVANAPK